MEEEKIPWNIARDSAIVFAVTRSLPCVVTIHECGLILFRKTSRCLSNPIPLSLVPLPPSGRVGRLLALGGHTGEEVEGGGTNQHNRRGGEGDGDPFLFRLTSHRYHISSSFLPLCAESPAAQFLHFWVGAPRRGGRKPIFCVSFLSAGVFFLPVLLFFEEEERR